MSSDFRVLVADCFAGMSELPDNTFDCCVTSPPYWGLRDYGVEGQLGAEKTPDEYVANMVRVFREVRRLLRDDGTLWLNLGDSYANDGKWGGSTGGKHASGLRGSSGIGRARRHTGLKPKDLVGIPWRVAFALQADGWWLRSDIVWAKPNPMPESVTDRPTRSHEYVFLLSKSQSYYYDGDAIKEPVAESTVQRMAQDIDAQAGSSRQPGKTNGPMKAVVSKYVFRGTKYGPGVGNSKELRPFSGNSYTLRPMRNSRDVWTISPKGFKGAHFAVMPVALAEKCVLAGSRAGGHVFDPFGGAGTTALAALTHGRSATLCELNPKFAEIAAQRIRKEFSTT